MKKITQFGKLFILSSIISTVFIIGYIKGINKFCRCDFKYSYKSEIIYGIGIITGLNGIIGYFNIGEIKN
jgi:hypothetical protein